MFNRSLQQRFSNHNYSLHIQRAFTQDWLNSFWIVVDCSIFCVNNNNCSIDFYNRDLQTTIILFICNVQYATQDWLNSFWIAVACYILPFISLGKELDECAWRRLSLAWRNLYKCKQVRCCCCCLSICLPAFFSYCTLL